MLKRHFFTRMTTFDRYEINITTVVEGVIPDSVRSSSTTLNIL